MTDKFIPFNPETAKNGDTVYAFGNTCRSYIYVGPCPNKVDSCVVLNPRDNHCGVCWHYELTVKAPKKTVWVNVYSDSVKCFRYDSEDEAKRNAIKMEIYVGTYPLEIDDVA